ERPEPVELVLQPPHAATVPLGRARRIGRADDARVVRETYAAGWVTKRPRADESSGARADRGRHRSQQGAPPMSATLAAAPAAVTAPTSQAIAARAVGATKTYGAGERAVRALDAVDVAF